MGKYGILAKIRILRAKNEQVKFWGGRKSDLKNDFFIGSKGDTYDRIKISAKKFALTPQKWPQIRHIVVLYVFSHFLRSKKENKNLFFGKFYFFK